MGALVWRNWPGKRIRPIGAHAVSVETEMIHVSAEQVVLIAELLNAADLKGWNAEVGDNVRRLNQLEMAIVGRLHDSEAAVVDRVSNDITPISIDEPRIIFRNDV